MKLIEGWKSAYLVSSAEAVELQRLSMDSSFDAGIVSLQGATGSHYGGEQPSLSLATLDQTFDTVIRRWMRDGGLVTGTVLGKDMILTWSEAETIIYTKASGSDGRSGAGVSVIEMQSSGYELPIYWGVNLLEQLREWLPASNLAPGYTLTDMSGVTTSGRNITFTTSGSVQSTFVLTERIPFYYVGARLRASVQVVATSYDSNFPHRLKAVTFNSAGSAIDTFAIDYPLTVGRLNLDFTVSAGTHSIQFIILQTDDIGGGYLDETFTVSDPMLSLVHRNSYVRY